MKRLLPGIISLSFLLLSLAIFGAQSNHYAADEKAASDKLAELKNQLEVQKVETDVSQTTLKKETTGLDVARVQKDDGLFKKFIQPVFTWKNGAEYDAARNQMLAKMDKDSDFMKMVMPPQKKSKDKKYTYVDVNELNCHYESLSSYVTKVDGSQYSYLSFITYSVNNSSGKEAKNQCVILYTVTADGGIEQVEGYTL